jgi:hypothetical protein
MRKYLHVVFAIFFSFSILSPINAFAVSSNPTPMCAGATCTVTFSYSGDYYRWTVPVTGSYVLETWGAAGGGTGTNYYGSGGRGGYAKGTQSLTAGSYLYIYVGQEGQLSDSINAFNGGGKGDITGSHGPGYGGGGATHVATALGALSDLSSNQSSVLIVAGGGGGGGGSTNSSWSLYATDGGAGGGTSGGTGTTANGDSTRFGGSGGTQSTAGTSGNVVGNPAAASFGRGGNGSATLTNNIQGGGGGGGWYGGGAGSDGGGGGGGGSGYVGSLSSSSLLSGTSTMPNPSGGTMTGRLGNGIAVISYPNGPTVTQFAPQTTITNSTSLTFSLIFSEAVTGLTSADFSKAGTGSSTCTIGTPSGSTTNYSIALSGCSPGTVTLTLASNAVSNSASQAGPSSATSAGTVTIDQTAPTVSSVTAPANSTYSNNQTPTFTMVFSESVTITGTPRLTLTVGASTKYANFLSLTDSKTATFRYTVTTDPIEFDTDGISVSTSIDINGGAIADLATNAISNLTFSAPTLTSVFIAQLPVAPTIDSVVATSGTLTIYFTPGAARGSTTSGYQYTTDNNTFKNRETGNTGSPLVITTVSTGASGLVNGTGYLIRIRAVTNAGNSSISNLVTETPTAISVTGDSTLILTYGTSGSTGSYSATGGTNTYTWSLGSSISGITLSGTTVTAANTLAAGTYSQTIRATDGNSQVGTKSLTITVNKASSSISIALPNSATNAALGGAVTITATVPRAGAVNFKLDGTTISGCGSASAASTTATCTWTPGAMGSVSLTAIFTPPDSTNYESANSTSLSITVVTGESSVTLQLTGGVTQAPKGQAINIIATVDQAGRITFLIDGKRIPGCNNKAASIGNVTCSWKSAVQRTSTITARLVPTNNVYNPSTSSLKVQVIRRTGLR